MEKIQPIYAELNFDVTAMDEKVRRVIAAQQELKDAIYELQKSVVDGLKINVK